MKRFGSNNGVVTLAVSFGAADNRTAYAHAKTALRAGVPADALRQIALAATPTSGLPAALNALEWIDESIVEECG